MVVATLLALLQAPSPPRPAAGAALSARLDSLLEAAHRRGLFNGVALVARGGQVLHRRALGPADAARSRPLRIDDRFSAGSIAKEFTAVALEVLARRGRVDLDAPLSRYVKGLPAWSDSIRVRHLLDYTGGLPQIRTLGVAREADLLDDLRRLPALSFAPGSGYLYSNHNILLRRAVIEAVTGESYARYAQRTLFGPCRMTGAITDPGPGAPRMARAFANGFVADTAVDPMRGWTRVTADDLFRWARCLDFGPLLPRTTLLRMVAADDDREGPLGHLDTVEEGARRHVHSGSDFNFEAQLRVEWRDSIVVVVLTNNKNFKVGEVADALVRIVRGERYEVPKRSLYLALRERMLAAGYDAGMTFYQEIRDRRGDEFDLRDAWDDLDRTAGYLERNGRADDARRLRRFVAARRAAGVTTP